MGEIGIDRDLFLYDLRLWEVRAIVRGYRRRERGMWEMVRWQTFCTMQTGMADLKKAGINGVRDLLTFPWEEEAEREPPISAEEVERIREELRRANEGRKVMN